MHALAGLPDKVIDVIRAAAVVEYATMSTAGVPIDTPTLCFPTDDLSSLDVGTGLAYPAKADRARRNPKVGLLVEGLPGEPVVSVAGHAFIRDTDFQANLDRYLAETAYWMPGAPPWPEAHKAVWYWTRIIVQVAPVIVRWWDSDAAMDSPPHIWHAPPSNLVSDPAPSGKPSPVPPWPQPAWEDHARNIMATGAPGHLTLADDDGYPLPIRARTVTLTPTGFDLDIPAAAPWQRAGKATLSFQGRAIFVGDVTDRGGVVRFAVERVLPVLPFVGTQELWNPSPVTLATMMGRLGYELERRGQSIPTTPNNLPALTEGATLRIAGLAAQAEARNASAIS